MRDALVATPRVTLAHLPTPLEALPRLGAALGVELYVKRDDCTGLATGGNKARKLEFLLADALAQGADTLVTKGGLQSNHVRQTAAAAARFGLGCHLVLADVVPDTDPDYAETGNLFLDRLLGATCHLAAADQREAVEAEVLAALRAEGRAPYAIPYGGSNVLGALGYVAAAVELSEQLASRGLQPDVLLHASGSSGTQAGLVVGCAGLGLEARVLGIDVNHDPGWLRGQVLELTRATATHLGVPDPSARVEVLEGYAGPGYGVPTPAMRAAVERVARAEGLLLDPVYTGKAFAALVDLVERGELAQGSTVIFVHTGGAPGLFAYRSSFR
ncbi:MAG: D-cysteine desulfhydrase family protein [Planctomycetes bacterium]|nr:D-cysteine desulfhydrase family protein [Planctomycetota bacterium]